MMYSIPTSLTKCQAFTQQVYAIAIFEWERDLETLTFDEVETLVSEAMERYPELGGDGVRDEVIDSLLQLQHVYRGAF